jgi:hypothetical protein
LHSVDQCLPAVFLASAPDIGFERVAQTIFEESNQRFRERAGVARGNE